MDKKNLSALYQASLHIKSVLPLGHMDEASFRTGLQAIAVFSHQSKSRTQPPVQVDPNMELAHALLDRLAAEVVAQHPPEETPRSHNKNNNDTAVEDDAPAPTHKNALEHLWTARPYIQVLRGWALTRTLHGWERCQSLWQDWQERHAGGAGVLSPHDNPHVYMALLYAAGLSPHTQARTVADAWVRAWETRATVLPTEVYNSLILVHAQRAADEYGAAAAAEDWLLHLSQLYSNSSSSDDDQGGSSENRHRTGPTTDSFNRVLRAWSNSPEASAVDRAQTVLQLMLTLAADGHAIQPNVDSFATVLLAAARHGQPQAAASLWLATVDYLGGGSSAEEGGAATVVDVSPCFNALTLAWAKHADPTEAVERLEALWLEQLTWSTHYETLTLDDVSPSITNLMTTLVGCGRLVEADERLRDFYRAHLLQGNGAAPLPGTLHFMVSAYNRMDRPDRAERAVQLVLLAVDASQKSATLALPETATLNMCIDLCLKCQDRPRAMEVLAMAESLRQASVYTYSLLINVLCRDKTAASAFEAVAILRRLKDADADPQQSLQLKGRDIGLYTAVMAALSSTNDRRAADVGFELFQDIKASHRWRPSTRMYTSTIFAQRLKGPTGRQLAFDVFEDALQAERMGHAKLDRFCFQTILKVLWRPGDVAAAHRSQKVMSTMLTMYDRGRGELEPNTACIDACLWTFIQSDDPTLMKEAFALYDNLRQRHAAGQVWALPSQDIGRVLHRK
jgi:hypothetical protein